MAALCVLRRVLCILFWLPLLGFAAPLQLQEAWLSPDGADADAGLRQVLPYKWDSHHAGISGTARFVLEFDLPQAGTGLLGLYIPRVGNAFEISLNGALLASKGNMQEPGTSDTSKIPRFFEVSPLFLSEHNRLTVRIAADAGRRAGLSDMWFGPKDQVYSLYQHDWWWNYMAIWGVATFSTIVGILALTLWMFQIHHREESASPNERLYLYAGLAELCWAFKVGDVFVENPMVSWPYWSVLITVALAGWISFTAMFCAQTMHWDKHAWFGKFQALVLGMAGVGIVCAGLSLFSSAPRLMTLWFGIYGGIFLVFGLLFIRSAVRPGASWQSRMLAVAIMANVLVGCYDIYGVRVNPQARDALHLYYSSVLFGLGILLTVLLQFRNAIRQAQDLKDSTARRLVDVENELSAYHLRAQATATAQARVQERTRILRDMHDGVGSNISIAMRQLQLPSVDQHAVLDTLRESLDHLKLTVDTMNMAAGDIEAMLASLRYRLSPRLQKGGIELKWQVQPLPQVAHMDDLMMRQLMYMLYEAFSNACQHACATELVIEAGVQDGGVQISFTDNGMGFHPASTVKQGGLKALQDRAASIPVQFSIASAPGRTRLQWTIPITDAGRRAA